ncbi:BolA protein [Trypanosoma melophagium]|uniref:BolA protein n=1 Tax=Trypanosoma melophagium TaxID=715481 RepID=UPI00351A6675|nr:BolA protein [Trypanosoma melophagium]
MVTVTEMETRIRSNLEPISCEVTVLSEEDNKYSVAIVSNKFKDLPLIKRHRMVNDLFKDELLSGEIHALTISADPPK